MMKFLQHLLSVTIVLALLLVLIDARPNAAASESNQDSLNTLEPDEDEVRNAAAAASAFYDMPVQSWYPPVPMDRLQMLIAQYRPTSYLRSPTWNGLNELYRVPESKRQVRYRQCYFNPISCFKK